MHQTGNPQRGGYFVAFMAGVIGMLAVNGGMSQFKAQMIPNQSVIIQEDEVVNVDEVETITKMPGDMRASSCEEHTDCGGSILDFCDEGTCTNLVNPKTSCHPTDPKLLVYTEEARNLAKTHECASKCTDVGGLARCF